MSYVFVKSESRYPVNRKTLRERVRKILAEKNIVGEAEVSIIVVGDRKMKALNKKYRGLNETSAVLAFPLDDPRGRQFPLPFSTPDGVLRLGDIVISFPQAVKMAAEEEKLVDDKILELVEHGIGKLLGSNF